MKGSIKLLVGLCYVKFIVDLKKYSIEEQSRILGIKIDSLEMTGIIGTSKRV